jgi:excisionase family DNA binding protein
VNNKESLSTGEAATLCAVTPDTILKWIKSKKLPATKTPGGHYRIKKNVLQPFTINTNRGCASMVDAAMKVKYCWEYQAKKGPMLAQCTNCLVFLSRTERCYVIKANTKNLKNVCACSRTSCYDCDYYALTHQPKINVLIVTNNNRFVKDFVHDFKSSCAIHFTSTQTEFMEAVRKNPPNLVILDTGYFTSKAAITEFLSYLKNDLHLESNRILAVLNTSHNSMILPKGIFSLIKMPGTAAEVELLFRKHFKRPAITKGV